MTKTIACTIATALAVGFCSIARAEEPLANTPPKPLTETDASDVGEGSAESIEAASASPSPRTIEPSGDTEGARAEGQKRTVPEAIPQAKASAALPAQEKKPLPPKPKEKGSHWGKLKPCKNPDGESGWDFSTDCSGAFGIRGGVTRTSGAGPRDAASLTLSTDGEEYVRRGIWTARSLHRLAIGSGGAGLDGTLLGSWALGVRLPISPCRRHGPVLRAGMYGYIRGNQAYYGSLLELPQVQLGYQYMHGKTVIELGSTAGAVLVGRSRAGDSERRVLGAGFERGGYAAIQFPWMRLGISGSRLPVNDSLSSPVDVFEGTLCARAIGMALCADGRATKTHAMVAARETTAKVRSVYAGITLGFTRE